MIGMHRRFSDIKAAAEHIKTLRTGKSFIIELLDELEAYRIAMPLARAQELAKADAEGRLVVLPCKVGDVAYMVNVVDMCVAEYKIHAVSVYEDGRYDVEYYDEDEERVYSANLGFDGFLTRAEAEAALKEMESEE